MIRFLIFLLFLFLLVRPVSSQTPIELRSERFENFKNKLSILEDASHKYTIDDVLKNKNKFNYIKEIPNYETSLSTYWISFKIKKELDMDYFLEIANPQTDILDLYIIGDNNTILSLTKGGNATPYDDRTIKRNTFIYPLHVPLNKEVSVYLKYQDIGGLELPMKIYTSNILVNNYAKTDLLFGLYYGILVLSILYNFFLYITIKDYSYLFYVLSIFFFGIFQTFIHGHIYHLVWIQNSWLMNEMIMITGNLFMLTALTFVRLFIHDHISFPKLYIAGRVLKILCVISISISVTSLLLPKEFIIYNQNFLSVIAILFPIYMISVGLSATFNGYRPAMFFLIAWTVFLLGIILFVLYANGFLPNNTINKNMMLVGSALEAILLSFALGHRYTILKKEKEITQSELNRKLEVSNEKLLKINSDLDNFVYTASHDLKAPISNLEGLVNHIKYNESSKVDIQPIIDMMSISITRLKNTIEDLTEISKVNKNMEVDIHSNHIPEVVDEIRSLLKNQLDESGAEIITQLYGLETIRFSKKNFRSIMYNLVNNAIKYRSHDRKPEILINTEVRNNYVLMAVTDNGIGINEQNRNKVFEMFRRAHNHVEGTGIGLYLVKRMIENEGGRIELESNEGKGSTFKVYFKIDHK